MAKPTSTPKASSEAATLELTYPLRTAARLTGLSPEVLRAWERRYEVVVPVRTSGGTRRYTASDLERLRLVKAAVDAGHRVGQVAGLGDAELKLLARDSEPVAQDRLEEVLTALDALDAAEAQRLMALQLAALGPVRFAGDFACPLVREIGERWVNDLLGVSAEHLATGVLRSMLGAALQPTAVSLRGPRIVFATPSGERHELGLLMAALTALGGGANPLYLGAEVPVQDLLAAVDRVDAVVLALGVIHLPENETERAVSALRRELPKAVALWVGGAAAASVKPRDGVECFGSLEQLEQRVALLVAADPATR
jgi:DNA-binding transcriptional MerR regulator